MRTSEDTAEMLQMVRLLAEVGYRELSKSANAIRLSVSRRLSREGVTSQVLTALWHYAKACDSSGTPERLFAWWLDLPSRTMGKISEMRAKSAWIKVRLQAAAETPQQREDRRDGKIGELLRFTKKA